MPQQIAIPIVANQNTLQQSIQKSLNAASRNATINVGVNSKSISSLSQPLGKITGQANEFTKSMEAANARVFAFGASVGIINGISKAFQGLVSSTIEVEKSLADINTVLNISSRDLDKFGGSIFSIAKETGQSFDTTAKAALELSRQGLNTTETLSRLRDAMVLSRQSGLDATDAVEGLTAAVNSFQDKGLSSADALNKMVNVAQKFAISEKDIIEGVKRSAAVADQAGVSFDELAGIITAVQQQTARGGAVIGNSMKTIFSKIQDRGVLDDLQDLGITVYSTATGKVLPATKILENLAKQLDGMSQGQQSVIEKRLGGVFQLSNLIASLKDMSKAQSVYSDATETSLKSSGEAYKKNAALNETLAASINKVSLSAEEMGATLGKVGFADSAKNILSIINTALEGIEKLLKASDGFGETTRAIVGGIGSLVTGPGLVIISSIGLKLTKDFVMFGVESLKAFFNLNKAALEVAGTQKIINDSLMANESIQNQILGIENSALTVEQKRAAQAKIFSDALGQQLANMKAMQQISANIAPTVTKDVKTGNYTAQAMGPFSSMGTFNTSASPATRSFPNGVSSMAMQFPAIPLGNQTVLPTASKPIESASKDLTVRMLAYSAALSVLSGATDALIKSDNDSTALTAKMAKSAIDAGSDILNLGIVAKMSSSLLGASIGGFISKLTPWGIAAVAAYEAYKFGIDIYNQATGAYDKSSQAVARFTDTVNASRLKFSDYNEESQKSFEKQTRDILYNLENGLYDSKGNYISQEQAPSTKDRVFIQNGPTLSDKSQEALQKSLRDALSSGMSSRGIIQSIISTSSPKTEFSQPPSLSYDQTSNKLAMDRYSIDKTYKRASISESSFGDIIDKLNDATSNNQNPEKLSQDLSKKTIADLQKIKDSQAEINKLAYDYNISDADGNKAVNKLLDEQLAKKQAINAEASKNLNTMRGDFAIKSLNDQLDLTLELNRQKLDANDKELIRAQILGGYTDKELSKIQLISDLKKEDQKTEDVGRDILKENLNKIKDIAINADEYQNLMKSVAGFSADDFANKNKILELLGKMTALTVTENNGGEKRADIANAIAAQVGQTLDKQKQGSQITKDRIILESQLRDVYSDQKTTLDSIVQNMTRINANSASVQDLNIQKRIAGNQNSISLLEQSKRGANDLQIASIDKQIAAINSNTNALESQKEYTQQFSQAKDELIKIIKDSSTDKGSLFASSWINEANKATSFQDINKIVRNFSNTQDNPKTLDNLKDFSDQTLRTANSLATQAEISQTSAKLQQQFAGQLPVAIKALDLFSNSLLQIPQKIEDLNLESMTNISGKRLAEIAYDKTTLEMQSGKSPQDAAKIAKDRQDKPLGQLFKEGFDTTAIERSMQLKNSLIDASIQFKDNIINGLTQAIEQGDSLGDILKNAALEFARSMTKASMQNITSSIFSTAKFATGGKVSGGSGSKDDIPAMLMGGEYVINKDSVSKYGQGFLNAINSGTLNGYASGGKVQNGPKGTFVTPGSYDTGSIKGSNNLLSFATQAATSGARDQIVSGNNYSAIALEAESARLTNYGRRNGPAAEALRSAKSDALGVYFNDIKAREDLKKQQDAKDKALRNQLIAAGVSFVGGAVIGAAVNGASAGWQQASSQSGATFGSKVSGAAGGVWGGGNVNGVQAGGLKNLFTAAGKGLSGDLTNASNYYKLSQTSDASKLAQLSSSSSAFSNFYKAQGGQSSAIEAFRSTAYGAASIDPTTAKDQALADSGDPRYKGFSQTVGASGRTLMPGYSVASNYFPLGSVLNIAGKEYRVDDTGGMGANTVDFYAGNNKSLYNLFSSMGNVNVSRVRDTGGSIPDVGGIDTVSTSLSGGEFVMNRAATKNLGAGNLESLNAGASSIATDEKNEELNSKILSKLDELISAIGSSTPSINISVDSSGKTSESSSSGETSTSSNNLGQKIKDVVVKVLQEEKRLGGSLR